MTALHVSSNVAVQLTEKECRTIASSIQQLQLGEGSRGRHLLEQGQKFGRAMNDPMFGAALDIFIKEEQQLSRYLSAFMESQSIPLAEKLWVDTVFRRLRRLAGLELTLTGLATAELIAVPYDRALLGATGSPILKIICARILEDESNRLKFQASMVARLASTRPAALRRALNEVHRLFLMGIMLVEWIEHHAVFEATRYNFRRFKNETLLEFSDWKIARSALMKLTAARQKLAIKNFRRAEPET
jgi:hypothetical protein